MHSSRFLPGVPGPQIEKILNAAPGDEIRSGKFDSPESSAALAVNAFGYFLNRAQDLPPLPGCNYGVWPATSLALEAEVKSPWKSEHHPHLDVLVTTPLALIGIESKRFEPFRQKQESQHPFFSDKYWRLVWGIRMEGYKRVRDKLDKDARFYTFLNAAQLVRHALALRTRVHQEIECQGLTPILFYLYAEPAIWPTSRVLVDHELKRRHRKEIETFAKDVEGDEVRFISYSYRELLANWKQSRVTEIQAHAEAVIQRFSP